MSRPSLVTDLDTPALLIDLDLMERNLMKVAAYSRDHKLRVRPHTKTHKIPALGRRQLDLGATGLTVAKVGEAEVMLEARPPELLVAFPVIGESKLDRLMQVARETSVTVSLDSLTAAEQLSAAAGRHQVEAGVLAEVDVGLGRVGVTPGEALLKLVQSIHRLPHLRWDGIAFYPGQIKMLDPEGQRAIDGLAEVIAGMLAELRRAGFEARIVSGGSTPTLYETHRLPGVNEIRPGTYIFNDRNTVLSGACALEECAASILVTVVSTAKRGQIIVDGGSKTFSSDRAVTGDGFGRVLEAKDAVFGKMNEEHGFIDIGTVDHAFQVGDRVRIIPNHVCVAVNLHENVYGIRGDAIDQVWRVAGRGKLQ